MDVLDAGEGGVMITVIIMISSTPLTGTYLTPIDSFITLL